MGRIRFAVVAQYVGAAVASVGVGLWSVPAGLVTFGVGLVAFGAIAEAGDA